MHADRRVDQPLAEQVDDQLVELAVEIFTMLADATRVRIVLALKDGELSVNTLADLRHRAERRWRIFPPHAEDRCREGSIGDVRCRGLPWLAWPTSGSGSHGGPTTRASPG
jgi:hypothetical protein